MFGNKSLPTKIYSYGAKRGPIENADECYRQLRAAHRYRNKLVEVEKNRRLARDKALCDMFPALAKLEESQNALLQQIAEIQQQIKERRSGQNLRLLATKEEKKQIANLKKELKALRSVHRETKKQLRESEEAQQRLKAIDTAANETVKNARATCDIAWGTYLHVEQAIQQAKKRPEGPQFRRFTGDGKLVVQLQGGITVEQLHSCQDRRVRLEPLPENCKRRGKACETTLWLRIGSQGVAPIWATFRVRMDRPLPEDCRIKWVYAVARRVATKVNWSVQFVVSREEEFTRQGWASAGVVAIDIGWRMVDDGLRVAYLLGDDNVHQQVLIPANHMRQWAQVEDLRSLRDTHFNETRETVAVWRDAHKKRLPEWFNERTKQMRKWRSPAQLAALVLNWRNERITGDDVVFTAAEAWRTKDKHLYEWEANLRRKAVAWRKDFYRCIAAQLALKYKTVVVEEIDLKKTFAHLPAAEVDQKAARLARRNRTIAAISELRRSLTEVFGENVWKINPAYTSKRCHKCGTVGEHDDPTALSLLCPVCFAVLDRDYNAAANMLAIFEKSSADETSMTARTTDHTRTQKDTTETAQSNVNAQHARA